MKQTLLIVLTFFTFNLFSQEKELTIQLNDSSSLLLVRTDFIEENRQIEYWKGVGGAILSIDKGLVYGTDATMPKYELKKAILTIGESKIELSTVGMYDPWYDNEENIVRFKLSKFLENPYRLRGSFSVGAGMYFVEWSIIHNKSFRTIILYDWTIINEKEFIKE